MPRSSIDNYENTHNQNDMKMINMLLALNHIPVVIKEKNGTYQAYSSKDGRVMVYKKDMLNNGKDLTPLGILSELAVRNRQNDDLVTICRMMFKGNKVAAWRILNS